MKHVAGAAIAVVLLGACASVPPDGDRGATPGTARAEAPGPERNEVLQRILAATVKLEGLLDGDGRRTGSGVVIRSDALARRCWVLTTRHFVAPNKPREIAVSIVGHPENLAGEIVKVSNDMDLAVVSVHGAAPAAVKLKDSAHLGDSVWVTGFPWGRRLTLVSGIVSQIGGDSDEARLSGPPRMIDASVSYGSSGGGIFEASTGFLIGIVEGYRTARVALPNAPESVLHVPVPGETTVVPSAGIRSFLASVSLDR